MSSVAENRASKPVEVIVISRVILSPEDKAFVRVFSLANCCRGNELIYELLIIYKHGSSDKESRELYWCKSIHALFVNILADEVISVD